MHAPGRVIKTSFIGLRVKPIYRIYTPLRQVTDGEPDGEVTDHYPFDLFTANTPDSGAVMKFWGRFYLCFDRRRKNIVCCSRNDLSGLPKRDQELARHKHLRRGSRH
ncbi:hypothetical protein CEXT_151381 [Caerostris extrusa]|uniref:Uncharacterized protein n=1 Tax=Caerostris extrusa TaxID=172846 RepID=A0AAV4M8J3_CAEEX|nr:hypothetical protein CEXT_151381 [Caerostris extrusa]